MRPPGDAYRPGHGLRSSEVISGALVPHITRGPGRPSGRNCPAIKRFARRRGLGSASRHGDGVPYIAPGRASLSPAGVISGTAVPHITPGPGSRMGRGRPAAPDFVAAACGSRREYAAWSCRISPSALVAGPPSPLSEPILVELLAIAHPGYTTAPSEARRRGRPNSGRSRSPAPSQRVCVAPRRPRPAHPTRWQHLMLGAPASSRLPPVGCAHEPAGSRRSQRDRAGGRRHRRVRRRGYRRRTVILQPSCSTSVRS